MQGTLRVQIVTRTQNALSLIDKLRGRGKRIISALPGDPRPQVIKILYPSRAPSPLEVSICSLQRGSRTRLQILPILISPTRITPRVIPPKSPTRFPIFFLRKFISQFRSHTLCSPPYCFMIEFIQWLRSKPTYLQCLSNMDFLPRSHHPFNGNRRSAARGGPSVSPRSR